jgi:hypothetical protein
MNAELRKAKDRADAAWSDAMVTSAENMAEYIPETYSIALWSRSVREMYQGQWCQVSRHPDGGWDWDEVSRLYKTAPKDRIIALKSQDRLCCLALVCATRERVLLRLLEGDPRGDCHMRGKRATIMLDLVATYGQRLGCGEIHLEPVNEDLRTLYEDVYGFERVITRKGETYMKKGL